MLDPKRWISWQDKDRYSDQALKAMCDEGIECVQSGRKSGIHFNVFNQTEANTVIAYMKDKQPDIPFSVGYVSTKKEPKQ